VTETKTAKSTDTLSGDVGEIKDGLLRGCTNSCQVTKSKVVAVSRRQLLAVLDEGKVKELVGDQTEGDTVQVNPGEVVLALGGKIPESGPKGSVAAEPPVVAGPVAAPEEPSDAPEV
jgi:hypothetical protein